MIVSFNSTLCVFYSMVVSLQQLSLVESIDSVDYEEFLERHQCELERDPDISVLCFPPDDVTVTTFARPCRTLQPILPHPRSESMFTVLFLSKFHINLMHYHLIHRFHNYFSLLQGMRQCSTIRYFLP